MHELLNVDTLFQFLSIINIYVFFFANENYTHTYSTICWTPISNFEERNYLEKREKNI